MLFGGSDGGYVPLPMDMRSSEYAAACESPVRSFC